MKKLGVILGAVFVIVVSPYVVQYGWNEIITTIVPVGKITVWQALGMDALLTFIWPVLSSEKKSYEEYSKRRLIKRGQTWIKAGGWFV